ncbi:uncharacterized protein Z520_12128 [Fonsecaea multimorphosa CBS 102226]|uniref:NmrA-like domain-containing protein n=1 Tax=Fonsecaea multimorphosa CBS 102226 TaxID=1442371 RepID=A0A0D2GRH1_9EURO|nr:uncharacterized protein Z520_12128 [Fonsecaea multimorphosa CBS 102226]KIX92135.1 hypothetical protein Z520_12128 [Fonsecaea multimorphosa CBS 102226]OAL17504.1 hypothetical protein AYO22_11539 [Fonsecaea multimorphosa]
MASATSTGTGKGTGEGEGSESESELIVLTCASGRQCTQIIPLLYGKSSLRLVVNSEKSRAQLAEQYPDTQVVRANLQVPQECADVVDGATTVFYVGPPFHPYEVTLGMNMVDAAVAESRRRRQQQDSNGSDSDDVSPSKPSAVHFVFSSALHPEASKLLHHDQKRQIEEYLVESGLSYTILQPSTFMDNFIGQLLGQKDSSSGEPGTFMAPFNPSVPMSFSAVRDHAEVAVKVVRERARHFFATYQLVSTLPITTTEYVESISAVMGKRFDIKRTPFEQAAEMFVKMTYGVDKADDVDQSFRDAPEHMLLYYNKRGLLGNPGVLEWLLGRKPTTPAELARLKLKEAE